MPTESSANLTSEDTPGHVEQQVPRVRWKRMAVVVVIASAVALCFLWLNRVQPSPLGLEIRLDLISQDVISEQATVTVLNERKLYSFYSRFGPQRFVTLLIEESNGSLYLAFLRGWREGMLWRTKSDQWQSLKDWPSADQVRTFEQQNVEAIQQAAKNGYLPRPQGEEEFEITDLIVCLSDASSEFDANEGLNSARLGTAVRTGLVHFRFLYAEFHEVKWHAPTDGIEALDGSIESLNVILSKSECAQADCSGTLQDLTHLREHLVRAEELGLRFRYLAEDRSGDGVE